MRLRLGNSFDTSRSSAEARRTRRPRRALPRRRRQVATSRPDRSPGAGRRGTDEEGELQGLQGLPHAAARCRLATRCNGDAPAAGVVEPRRAALLYCCPRGRRQRVSKQLLLCMALALIKQVLPATTTRRRNSGAPHASRSRGAGHTVPRRRVVGDVLVTSLTWRCTSTARCRSSPAPCARTPRRGEGPAPSRRR